MKLFVATFIVLVGAALAADQYTTKYDGVNLEEILKSDRLLNNYYKCLMDTGKCTPDGNELKRRLPDALKTDCSNCKFNDKTQFYLLHCNLLTLLVILLKAVKNKRKELKELSVI